MQEQEQSFELNRDDIISMSSPTVESTKVFLFSNSVNWSIQQKKGTESCTSDDLFHLIELDRTGDDFSVSNQLRLEKVFYFSISKSN